MKLDAIDALEARLMTLDMQLAERGEHLDEERLACLVEGADPRADEAEHLTGCDDCTALLMVLGEGIEDLETWRIAPAVRAQAASPAGLAPPRRWPWVMAGLVFGAAAMAAAGWVMVAGGGPAPALAPATAPALAPATAPALAPATAPVQPAALPQPPPSASAPATQAGSLTAADPEASPALATASPDLPLSAASRPQRPRVPEIDAELRGRGPRAVAPPVDGPPRGYGFLRLNSRPRAQVFVDGQPQGWTPLVDLRLPEGPHDVRLVYESALAREPEERFRVIIEADQTWKALRRNTRPSP